MTKEQLKERFIKLDKTDKAQVEKLNEDSLIYMSEYYKKRFGISNLCQRVVKDQEMTNDEQLEFIRQFLFLNRRF